MANDGRLVILIVDDSELITEKMIGMLEEMKHVRIIFQAASYAEAAVLVQEIQPDLVLMDIVLREKTGMELLRSMQETYGGSILTVILTNHTGRHYREACMKLGAHYFLDKSSEFCAIPELINGLFSAEN